MQEHEQTDNQAKISDQEDAIASALMQVLEILRKLGPEGRKRVIDTVATFSRWRALRANIQRLFPTETARISRYQRN